MADSVPYGLNVEQLDLASPAAHAVAARLSHIVCDTQFWGPVRISAMFLNMVILSTLPHPEARRKMYHRVCKPQFEAALFEGLDAIEQGTMPADQRETVQLVRDYRAWRVAEDARVEKTAMKG